MIVINAEKSHIERIEGAYAPIIMQFGGEIGEVVYTNSVFYPMISHSSKQKNPKRGKVISYLMRNNQDVTRYT